MGGKGPDAGSNLQQQFKRIKSVLFIINLLEINLQEINDKLIFQKPWCNTLWEESKQ